MNCLTDSLKKALLTQVSCGIPDLREFLECELAYLWDSQDNCLLPLRYNYTLLGLIEAAQVFSRQQIDTMTRNAQTDIQERYDALAILRADSERDSSARACQWNVATSSQEFIRNSKDSAIGFTDYRHQYTSNFQNNGVDKTCRHTTGFGFHISRVESRHVGEYLENQRTQTDDAGFGYGGTGRLLPLYNLRWDWPQMQAGEFPFFSLVTPIDPTTVDVHGNIPESVLCNKLGTIDSDGNIVGPWNRCSEDDLFPSAGSGLNGHFDLQVGVVVGFAAIALRVSWDRGQNQRQYHTCQSLQSSSLTTHRGNMSNNDTSSTDAAEKDNQIYSSERSDNIHYVRKYGITVRRGRTDLDGEERGRGTAEGSAKSRSNRDGNRTGYSTERSESETTRHSESLLTRHERANNDMIRNKYGQISQQLNRLWQRIWDETQILERQFAAVPYGAAMNCVRSETCCSVRVPYRARAV